MTTVTAAYAIAVMIAGMSAGFAFRLGWVMLLASAACAAAIERRGG